MEILFKGIDVSHHQGKIDWTKINKNEVQFAMIRAGYGRSTVDEQFKNNIEGAVRAGIYVGVYWFSYAASVENAIEEAEFCLQTLLPYKQFIKFPVFFDWEYQSHDYVVKQGITPTKSLVSNMAIAFMDKIKSAGYMTGNYTNPDYAGKFFNDTVKNNYDTWLAHTGTNGAARNSTTYAGKYTMWQYCSVGKITGINGNVDLDYCYKNYSGNNININTANTTNNSTSSPTYLVDYKKEQASKVVTYNYSTQGNLLLSPHFQVKEFKSPDSTTIKIDNRLIWILERLFTDLNCSKMIINSGYRTPAYSVKVGGASTDRHVAGCAADIRPYDKNGKIISAKIVCQKLCDYGDVFGIGYISETAVHCDSRPKSAIWFGDETTGTSLIKSGYTNFDEYFNSKILTVNSGTWNVRDKASTTGKILTVVKGGTKYKYTKTSNGWAYIPELKGWLSSKGYTVK